MTAIILSLDTARADRTPITAGRTCPDPTDCMFRPAPPVHVDEPPSDDPAVERAADVLREMESRPWIAPRLGVGRDLDRRWRVHLAVGGVSVGLDAAEARLVAAAIRAEQGGAGGGAGLARDVECAADQAEAANAAFETPSRRRRIATAWWVVAALAVMALILAAAIR